VGDYTIRNLREVEDMAPKFGMAPDVSARFASGDLALQTCGISLQRLAPGARMPFGHRHARQEEVYVVVAGTARVKLGEEIAELGQWDALRVAPEVTRAFEAGPDGCELLAFGAPRDPESPDVEMEQGWWSD
jgi:mannose-6-phosphate isomerase-like protein (cupin superfamily)